MLVKEKINKYIQQLPENRQEEVLDFVEFLFQKSEQGSARQEERKWSKLSLSYAMRGMETEDMPEYTSADLKERFQ